MKFKSFIIIYIISVLIFSCNKKKDNNNENIIQETEKANIEKTVIETEESSNNGLNKYYALDNKPSVGEWGIEDYKKAIISEYLDKKHEILEFEEFTAFETGEKSFLCKWSSKRETSKGIRETIYFDFFVFNKNHEFKEKLVGLQLEEKYIEAFAQGIPGIRLWDAPVFIGDFNNDGQKEIASFFNTASAPNFQIVGIDPDSKNLVCYFDREVVFGEFLKPIITPVEFIRYKNMDGFKMLRMEPLEISNVKYPYVDYEGYNGYKGFAWFFYTWDEREKEYVIVEEFDPYYSF